MATATAPPVAAPASAQAVPAEGVYSQPQFAAPAGSQISGNTPASLYVGDLEPSVSEAALFSVFNQIGPVVSIRVCRDAVTRRSLGYGYVNFLNTEDAETALEQLNYVPLSGVPMRLMWSNRDPAIRRSGTGNIFIKNLHESIDHKALHDTFSAFGNILSCKISMEGNKSKGYGFVHYETMEMAENAIKHVNGMLLNDQQVYVGLHISKKERMSKLEELRSNFTNIFVKNLDASVTEEQLQSLFSPFGPIVSCALMKHDDGRSKEFAFINFENHEHAAKAVEEMNDKEISGKQIYVGRAQKKIEREAELRRQYEKIREEKLSKYQGVNLYVKNLDESIDDEKLRQEFASFGVITSAKVMLDEKTGLSRGFGFICFSNPDEATKAVAEMNNRMVANKPIYVALAQRKEVRQAQISAQIAQYNIRMQQQMQMPAGYPAAPAYYPGGMPPQQQRGFYPPGPPMMQRPRWNGPSQPPVPGFPQSVPPQQAYGVPMNGVRPQRAPRPPNQQVPQQGRIPGGPQGQQASQMPQPGAGFPPRGRGSAGNYKYTTTARNTPNVPQQHAQPARPSLNATTLASLPPQQQKQTLGEALFPLVQAQSPQAAGKITGMLLEMDNAELLHLLESPEALQSKITEAHTALEEHMRIAQESAGAQ